MKKLFAAFFPVLLIPFLCAAQSNYKPGYLVTLTGDTLHGFISRKAGNRTPVTFAFKDSLNSGQVKSFSVANARVVVITGGEIYTRFVVDISQDREGDGSLAAGPGTKPVKDMVFLNLIDSGSTVTLYQYTDKIKERFFISEKNAKPVELVLHVYAGPGAANEPVRQETYKRQLQSLAVKYLPQFQTVVDEAQEAAYTREDLEKIVFELNGADKESTFTSARQYKARSFIGIGFSVLGVHDFTTVDYLGSSGAYSNGTTKQAVSGELNLGEDIFLDQKETSMVLRLELHLTYSGTSSIMDGGSGGNLLEQYHTLATSLNPQLLFNIYDSGGTKIYLGAGGQVFFLGGAKTSYIAANYDELNPPAYYALNFTFTTRADIVLNNKLDIYAGYIPPSRQQQNTVSAFRAGLIYLFGANK